MSATDKHISKELAQKICQRVDNHSSYAQQLAWLVWIHTDKGSMEQDFEAEHQDINDQSTPLFEKQTESLTTYQMNFLRAIIDGVHSEFTMQEILQKYRLGSSANVSIIKRALVKKNILKSKNVEAFCFRQPKLPSRLSFCEKSLAPFSQPDRTAVGPAATHREKFIPVPLN